MRTLPALALLASVCVHSLSAQSPTDAPAAAGDHGHATPGATAVRVGEPIRIDGRLDEEVWSRAEAITGLTQVVPTEGEPASERSEIRFLYDGDALYIGAALYDSHPVTARLGRRDMGMSASDWLTVIIDSYHDHRTAYGFEVNPLGVRRDQTRGSFGEDDSWDPVWEVQTTVTDAGWFAELRIPFSQMRFSGADEQTWGLQVERQIARVREFSVWSYTPADQPGGIPRFGHVVGLTEIPTGKRLELLPYTVTRAEYIDRGPNPFRSNEEYGVNAGVDVKYRVTSNLTLAATINPDFGQVEVDPAVINLSAFETFFPEKRPFFVEGAEIFRFGEAGSNNIFYSRRIGRAPSVTPPFAQRDVPESTRILGAAKLSGRTANGWSIGVFDAVTASETARYRTPADDDLTMTAEPATNYFVSRVRRDLRSGLTSAGGFFGAVNRDLETDALANALRSAAYTGGIDLSHEWDDRTWRLNGFVAASHVRGEPAAIAASQRAPYHYFHRPDADHLEFDPARESLTGFTGALLLSKRVGRHWDGGASLSTVSPEYEVSDLGFQRRADRIDANVRLSYSETRPGSVFRSYDGFGSLLVEHNYGGENVSNRIFAGAYAQFLSYWGTNMHLSLSLPGTVDDRLTRGGPAARRPGTASLSMGVSSDSRKALVARFGGGIEGTDAGGRGVNGYVDLLMKPAPNWELSLGPSLSRSHSAAQYLFAAADPLASRTYGARYVFAELDQTVLALETRLNYTFTPRLSLQVFAQPFIAAGEYGPPMEFERPGAFDFLVYGEDVGEVVDGVIYPDGVYDGAPSYPAPQPDFNLRSLRGNAVLRWEWRPGSTIYLAWQQQRQGYDPNGDFELGRDVRSVFSAPADDVLLLKVNYWINP